MSNGPQTDGGPVGATSTATTAGATGAVPSEPPTTTPSASSDVPLQSLTPKYVEERHGTYLRRLEAAVKDPLNLNIALTGRYGAGKSSVLDEFQSNHRRSVQRLAISSLAPGEESQASRATTNEIQKEIVKHLLYGASQKVGKNSRFNRIAVLTWPRAVARSVPVVVCAGVLLHLLGRLPEVEYTGSGEPTWVRVAVWAGVAGTLSVGLALVLRATHGRFRVTDVSAGGAALTLSENPETFFDKFTDEIVHYFDRESKDIVVFEDLDRFEDPRIFEALRELNLLLNNTPRRQAKRRGNLPGRTLRWLLGLLPGDVAAKVTERLPFPLATRLLGLGVPVRFVYAVKDSVFEKIDTATATAAGSAPAGDAVGVAAGGLIDAAAAETQRANRTKFFDIVIPLVPFISHRNARELLIDVLDEAGIGDVDRRLVNVVARYCTDMRLLRNMCNEYLLFAERLLEGDRVAPDLNSSKIFALVAYKNFHPGDFENISRGESDLDKLYELHQQMVRESIAALEQAKRVQRAAPTRARERDELATRLGGRLGRYADSELKALIAYNSSWRHTYFKVGPTAFPRTEVTGREFWTAVAQRSTLTILASTDAAGASTNALVTLDRDDLDELVPEALDAHRWNLIDTTGTEADLAALDRDIRILRQAGFGDLAFMHKFTLTMPTDTGTEQAAADGTVGTSAAATATVEKSFASLIEETLKSDLARELVKRGHIDRNFSLYAAQFYGHFSGTDVATFMVRHAQNNTMNVDYDLSRDGAAASVIHDAAEAGEDLLHSVAAYNIDLVNHLLITSHPGTGQVVRNLIAGYAENDNNAVAFLAAYLTTDTARREELVTQLAEHQWEHLFNYLATTTAVLDGDRPALVSAALAAADPNATLNLDDAIGQFIVDHYTQMPVLTGGPQAAQGSIRPAPGAAQRAVTVLDRANVVIPDLNALNDHVLRLVVDLDRYGLTADNIRKAAGITGEITLDAVSTNSMKVYDFCLRNLGEYLRVIDSDPCSEYTVRNADTLLDVLTTVTERADVDPSGLFLSEFIKQSAPEARLRSLRAAPQSTWEALAAADRFRASLANVEDYRTHPAGPGAIDTKLVRVLENAATIYTDEPGDDTDADGNTYDRTTAATKILNATAIAAPAMRVILVEALAPPTPLPVANLNPEGTDLFARLLAGKLIDDDADTFTRIYGGGWDALRPAIHVSNDIATFLEPEHVRGWVAEIFRDDDSSGKLGNKIVSDLDAYVPAAGRDTVDSTNNALLAAADYAHTHRIALPADTVVRIAEAANGTPVQQRVTLRLLRDADPAANGQHVLETFDALGDPYKQISHKEKFNVDKDPDGVTKALLDKLDSNRFKVRQRPLKEQWTVTIV